MRNLTVFWFKFHVHDLHFSAEDTEAGVGFVHVTNVHRESFGDFRLRERVRFLLSFRLNPKKYSELGKEMEQGKKITQISYPLLTVTRAVWIAISTKRVHTAALL